MAIDDTVPGEGIQRSFRDLSDQEVADVERASALTRYGLLGGFGWTSF